MKRQIRRVARLVIALFGAANGLFYLSGGMTDHALAVTFAMSVMISATNFCTQCPLLSSVKHWIISRKKTSINIKRL